MSSSNPVEAKREKSEIAPEPIPSLPEVRPAELTPDDDDDGWAPKGPPKLVVTSGDTRDSAKGSTKNGIKSSR
ncbi:hypothetical protein DAEQUDRAFT_733430 [Daedalea quercina L-15889]|uniref:Uncharacterized protein n=1 Tax=Daedalea quercina L-15889 TaxID=1314783 RepID=A0A165KZE8_9APHY|nr:hypothetical protein DAEQUDRAFT_733430 [Daedalea quercina L-15889]